MEAWSIGDAKGCWWRLEQETLRGTIEEKPVKLSFSLSFPYFSLTVHNFLHCELLALTEMLGVQVVSRA